MYIKFVFSYSNLAASCSNIGTASSQSNLTPSVCDLVDANDKQKSRILNKVAKEFFGVVQLVCFINSGAI